MDTFNMSLCLYLLFDFLPSSSWWGSSSRSDSLHVSNPSDAPTVAVTETWHLSCLIREECTSSSCLTHTLQAGCVCSLWPYLSPYVLAGCMVRWELKTWVQISSLCFMHIYNSLSLVSRVPVTQFKLREEMTQNPLLESYFSSALCWRMVSNTCSLHFIFVKTSAYKWIYLELKNVLSCYLHTWQYYLIEKKVLFLSILSLDFSIWAFILAN